MLLTCSNGLSQELRNNFFGNPKQPGTQLNQAIFKITEKGYTDKQAITFSINEVISNANSKQTESIKQNLASDIPMSEMFFSEMMATSDLIYATKVVTESNPDKLVQAIRLTTSLYPDYVQEIYSAVLMTGLLPSQSIKNIFVEMGIDADSLNPLVSAQISNSAIINPPLGVGIGSGGTGAGDITVSSN